MWYQSESARPMPPAIPVSVGIAQPAKTAAVTTATTYIPYRWPAGAGGASPARAGTSSAPAAARTHAIG